MKKLRLSSAGARKIDQTLKAGAKIRRPRQKVFEDPGSAKEGGSLGWIGKAARPEFEKAASRSPCQVGGLGEEQLRFTLSASMLARTRT